MPSVHNAFVDNEAEAPISPSTFRLDKLGAIEVEMRRAEAFRNSDNLLSMGEFPEIGPVHERSKKAGVHTVS